MTADNPLHAYSEATKKSCGYVALALFLLVLTTAGTSPASPLRWVGKAMAIVAAFYATYMIAHGTYGLARDKATRTKPGALRNATLSGVLCVALVGLVAAAAT
tara:strand:+ start:59 stop:367 length:309 start_codon:yes stop_codon:yes gene_type:complete